MAKVIMRAIGVDGQIALLSDRVVIQREGLWNALRYGFHSRREIPLGAISEIMFRDAGALRFGEIEFIRGGRGPDEHKKSKNSMVKFHKKNQKEFEDLKEKVFELVEQLTRQRS